MKLKCMSLSEMQGVYRELLKRYKEFGYLQPEDALNDDIHLLRTRGKTVGKAILLRYKVTTDETIELMERYIAVRARTLKSVDTRTQSSISKSQVRKETDEISAFAR